MSRQSTNFSKLLYAVTISSLIGLGSTYTSVAEARQGCGSGWHMQYSIGRCVPNGAPGYHQSWYHGPCWIGNTHYATCPQ